MFTVYLCEYIHPTAYEKLKSCAHITQNPTEADAAINRNLKMDRQWMEQCPKLKVIGVHGTGTDGVDLAAAKELGIQVVYAPGENADSVAELIVAFALSLYRHIPLLDRQLQSGAALTAGGGSLVGRELRGKVFGMIGCGNIARKAARILVNGFGMHAVGFSPSLTQERADELGIGRCKTVEEVISQADIISIGVPLKDSTRNLVDADVLSHAKPGAVLINTARGGIVNEDALYEALVSGKLSAACDVFTLEPPTLENRLVTLPNFLATPHVGANTDEALNRVSNTTVNSVLKALNGDLDDTIKWVVR